MFGYRTVHLCKASRQWWGHSGHWWSVSDTVRSKSQPALHLHNQIKAQRISTQKEANTKHTDTVLTSHVSSFLPLWPSSVWFIERLLGAARPFSLASSGKNKRNLFINYWLTDAFHSSILCWMYRNNVLTFCLSIYKNTVSSRFPPV